MSRVGGGVTSSAGASSQELWEAFGGFDEGSDGTCISTGHSREWWRTSAGDWSLALGLGCRLWGRRGAWVRERLGDQRGGRKGRLGGSKGKRQVADMSAGSRSEQPGYRV